MNPSPLTGYLDALQYMIPEAVLTITIIVAALCNLFFPKAKEMTWFWTVGGLALALVFTVWKGLPQTPDQKIILFNGLFTYDAITVAFTILSLLVGGLVVMM